MTYLSALWRQLKHRSIVPEMKAGLWMIVEAIKNRNYLHGYDIYMRLAVGRRLQVTHSWPVNLCIQFVHMKQRVNVQADLHMQATYLQIVSGCLL